MEYTPTTLKKEFNISRIYTVHYFEYEKNYGFVGEEHDFWELVYVDKGEAIITGGGSSFVLKQGEAAFHAPMEYHNITANGVVAPNIVIVTFECRSAAMRFFHGRVIALSDYEKHCLSVIVREAHEAYDCALGDPFLTRLTKRAPRLFGCEQLIASSLVQLLISVRRGGKPRSLSDKPKTAFMSRLSRDIVAEVTEFMTENIASRLRFSDITEFAGMSGSSLKLLFRNQVGMGVMAYFARLKIDRAKSMIREGNYNITQISELLGYDSVHEFSRRFKSVTSMSPTEYGKSVKVELPFEAHM